METQLNFSERNLIVNEWEGIFFINHNYINYIYINYNNTHDKYIRAVPENC